MWRDLKPSSSITFYKKEMHQLQRNSLSCFFERLLKDYNGASSSFDFDFHQMDVKTTFLNGNIDETIYMKQPENFVVGNPEKMVYKLKKSIYRLKSVSHQWYFEFY